MSKELDDCELCGETYCAHCFKLELCSACSYPCCEECFDKTKECASCGARICPQCTKCDNLCEEDEVEVEEDIDAEFSLGDDADWEDAEELTDEE